MREDAITWVRDTLYTSLNEDICFIALNTLDTETCWSICPVVRSRAIPRRDQIAGRHCRVCHVENVDVVDEARFWWTVAAVLAQRPDLKTPAWIDRKLPSYALRHVRRADLSGLRGRPTKVQEDEYCAVKPDTRCLFNRRRLGMEKRYQVRRDQVSGRIYFFSNQFMDSSIIIVIMQVTVL